MGASTAGLSPLISLWHLANVGADPRIALKAAAALAPPAATAAPLVDDQLISAAFQSAGPHQLSASNPEEMLIEKIISGIRHRVLGYVDPVDQMGSKLADSHTQMRKIADTLHAIFLGH